MPDSLYPKKTHKLISTKKTCFFRDSGGPILERRINVKFSISERNLIASYSEPSDSLTREMYLGNEESMTKLQDWSLRTEKYSQS